MATLTVKANDLRPGDRLLGSRRTVMLVWRTTPDTVTVSLAGEAKFRVWRSNTTMRIERTV